MRVFFFSFFFYTPALGRFFSFRFSFALVAMPLFFAHTSPFCFLGRSTRDSTSFPFEIETSLEFVADSISVSISSYRPKRSSSKSFWNDAGFGEKKRKEKRAFLHRLSFNFFKRKTIKPHFPPIDRWLWFFVDCGKEKLDHR